MLPIPLSPQPLKIPLFTAFSSIFPCANAGSQLQHIYIYKKSFQNIVFWQCFSNVSSQTDGNLHVFCHKGSKSFQNIALDSVFVMFPVKHTVIYTFFAITSVQNTCFCSVFNALASKKPCKILLCTMFFSFFGRFPLPESYQNDPKFHFNTLLRSDTQKIIEKCRKHHRILVSVRNRFWAPPAKADIATAILTNVIEHLVLLLPPNKHAFTAKAVWADLMAIWWEMFIGIWWECQHQTWQFFVWWGRKKRNSDTMAYSLHLSKCTKY